jgi:hypothetical protein
MLTQLCTVGRIASARRISALFTLARNMGAFVALSTSKTFSSWVYFRVCPNLRQSGVRAQFFAHLRKKHIMCNKPPAAYGCCADPPIFHDHRVRRKLTSEIDQQFGVSAMPRCTMGTHPQRHAIEVAPPPWRAGRVHACGESRPTRYSPRDEPVARGVTIVGRSWKSELLTGVRAPRAEPSKGLSNDADQGIVIILQPTTGAMRSAIARGQRKSHFEGTRWSREHDCCVDCGTVERPHCSHGRCKRCYDRWRYRSQ